MFSTARIKTALIGFIRKEQENNSPNQPSEEQLAHLMQQQLMVTPLPNRNAFESQDRPVIGPLRNTKCANTQKRNLQINQTYCDGTTSDDGEDDDYSNLSTAALAR